MHKASTDDLASTDNQAIAATDIKLLVVDIDGTIAGESNNLTSKVLQAIAVLVVQNNLVVFLPFLWKQPNDDEFFG